MSTFRLRRLGIHGPRQSGKTCYLTVLHRYRKTDEAGVVIQDDTTLAYLQELWNRYLAAGHPTPRTAGLPTEIRLDVQASGQTWEVLTRDYPGERVQRPVHDEALQWLESCDAILVFLDSSSNEADLAERLNEVDVLLSALRILSADGHTIARPLALVLTKWDTHGPVNADDPSREEQRALAFLNTRPQFRQLYHALLQAGRPDRVRVFPVSAFGENRDGRFPPEGGPKTPLNLHAPIIWALEKSDECHAESARRRADAKLMGRWPNYRGALTEYDQLVAEKGISKGAVFDHLIEPERRRLRGLMTRRRLMVLTALIPLLLVLVAVGLYVLDTREYREVQTALNDHEQPPGQVASLARSYLSSWNPTGRLFNRDDAVEEQLKGLLVDLEKTEYDVLADYRRGHEGDEHAARRLEKAVDFRRRWPGSERDAVVADWEAEDRKASEVHERQMARRRAFESLSEKVQSLTTEKRYARILEEYDAFLAQWGDSEYGPKVRELKEAALVAKLHDSFQQLLNYEQRNPRVHLSIIERASPFLVSPIPSLRDQANKMIERHKTEADHEDYEAVREACHSAKNPADLKAAQTKAEDYLSAKFPPRHRRDEVKRWLDWLAGLQKPRDYVVMVRKVEIPLDSKLRDLYGNEEVRVTIRIDGIYDKTKWYKGKGTIDLNERLGKFRGEWGKDVKMEVLVEEYDAVSGTDRATGTVESSFVMWWTNSPFITKCAKNKEVTVYLECADLDAPRLPAYEDK